MAKGHVYQASLLIDVSLPAAQTGRTYQVAVRMPAASAPLRARVYQATLTTPAAGGGTGRVYRADLTIPLQAGQVPASGIWAARDGNRSPCVLRAAINGQN